MTSCYIIAEAGVNHNGSEELALQLVDVAVAAGVDAVKFQTFRAEKLVRAGAAKAAYQQRETGGGDQLSMLRALELSQEAHRRLTDYCAECSIEFMSTAFDEESADFLLKLGINRIKIPSGELTNRPFIEYLAAQGLPLILSTGMATLDEVGEVVACIDAVRKSKKFVEPLTDILTLLHCTSNYPAPLEGLNLRAMQTLAAAFSLPVGYSDHTAGILVAPLAVAMGATVVEKHFTLDRALPGPDHQASLEPNELKQLVANIRQTELALGSAEKRPTEAELEVREVARRSVTLRSAVTAGQTLTLGDLELLRPGNGIPPKALNEVCGRQVVRALAAGHTLGWDDLAP